MKKLLAVLLAIMLLGLVGCGNNSEKPDFKSVYDTETKTMFSLGDSKSKFDEAWGEGIDEFEYFNIPDELGLPESSGRYVYSDYDIVVEYKEGKALNISLSYAKEDMKERFIFKDFESGTTREKASGTMEESKTEQNAESISYHIWYDEKGEKANSSETSSYYFLASYDVRDSDKGTLEFCILGQSK